MRTHTQTALAALISTITLALALSATTATARNFQLTEKEWEILFREVRWQTSTNTISCPLTLLGRFVEGTIPKIVGTQVGAIRHALPVTATEPSPCTGGILTILSSTLPWLIFYRGFTGTLPRIEAVRMSLVGIAFRIRTSNGIGCLAGTTAAEPGSGEVLVNRTSGKVEGIRLNETTTIRLGGGFLCSLAGTSTFSGTGSVLNLPATRSIIISLI